MRFLTPTHMHIFLHFLIKKGSLKMGMQGNNLGIFLWNLKNLNLKKKFFWNLKILKFSMPRKITPKSQAKIKPRFPQYPFLTIFLTLKKYHANKYTVLILITFVRIYSNAYDCAIYLKLLWMAQIFFQVQYFKEHLCFEMHLLREPFM